MSIGTNSDDTLGCEEIFAALGALSLADKARIQRVSILLGGSEEAAEDLRQEAMCRALSGERKCPRDVSVARFLCEAMRSIKFSERRSERRRPTVELELVEGSASCGLSEVGDPGPPNQVEAEQEAERIRRTVLGLFHDDEVAQMVVEGIMEEMEGEELCELADIRKEELATKRKLIRRRIDRAFPKGWHDDP